ncbi:FERM central domain-containing protein [Ditylenchus destructor]|nr:FERM central domain-containing protein [Ditylenchus destructor]
MYKFQARKSPVAISLLYSEAEHNFLVGLYPCDSKCYIQLAAIILQRLYGDHQHLPAIDPSVLAHILPRHLIPPISAPSPSTSINVGGSVTNSTYNQLVNKILSAHKQLANTNLVQLQLLFLKYCWSLNVYGCTFFKAFMLMSKPLRGNLPVHVGVNDWGMSIINATTHKQVAALELKSLELKYTPNTNYLEATSRKRDFVATITTPQSMLINNLLKQLKTKVEAARSGSTSHQ